MTTLTYVKGLPTPQSEMNALGFTEMEMFLGAFSEVFRKASIETVNYLLSGTEFNKSKWNTHLQVTFKINKRHANGVIAYSKGKFDGAKEHRALHIETLTGKIKSISSWISKAEKRLKLARKFYKKSKWQASKTGCNFPMSCSVKFKTTNFKSLEFQIHGKKRKLYLFENKLAHLKSKPLNVIVPHGQIFIVGSKGEKLGNQSAQYDGDKLTMRVPACLESQFGSHVTSVIGNYDRKINRLPACNSETAKTWHCYFKDGSWKLAVQFTPIAVKRISRHYRHGCIGIDMNPGMIGWAYVDCDGNLKAKGQIPLEMGLPNGQQQAQIVTACLYIAGIAEHFECPVICENLDFATKKLALGEKGRKYSRMLSSWAYSEFYKQLNAILVNRGVFLKTVNPAYTSIIGLVKYMKMYGLSSDTAAALVIARRGMRLSEHIPDSITAYVEVNSTKHVWSQWNQLNKQISKSGIVSRRHDYYTVSSWSFLATQPCETE